MAERKKSELLAPDVLVDSEDKEEEEAENNLSSSAVSMDVEPPSSVGAASQLTDFSSMRECSSWQQAPSLAGDSADVSSSVSGGMNLLAAPSSQMSRGSSRSQHHLLLHHLKQRHGGSEAGGADSQAQEEGAEEEDASSCGEGEGEDEDDGCMSPRSAQARYDSLDDLVQHAASAKFDPSLFISGWDTEHHEFGVAEKDLMDPGEQFLTAAEDGDLESLERLLKEKSQLIMARDADLYTALHRASYNNHAEAIRVLLAAGADATARTEEGWTPLHCAACWGSFEAAQVLIDHANTDYNARTNGQLTPLHLAVSCTDNLQGGLQTTKLLLSQPNLDRQAVSGGGETAEKIAHRSSKATYQLLTNQ